VISVKRAARERHRLTAQKYDAIQQSRSPTSGSTN